MKTVEEIKDMMTGLIDSLDDAVQRDTLRPSGLIRKPTITDVALPHNEIRAVRSVVAVALLRRTVFPDKPDESHLMAFFGGYVWSKSSSVNELTQIGVKSLMEEGFEEFAPEHMPVINESLEDTANRFGGGTVGKIGDTQYTLLLAWVLGKRMQVLVADAKKLDEIFEQEWIGTDDPPR